MSSFFVSVWGIIAAIAGIISGIAALIDALR
jgi:hypothetical protein